MFRPGMSDGKIAFPFDARRQLLGLPQRLVTFM
jgi:hypothetical protein